MSTAPAELVLTANELQSTAAGKLRKHIDSRLHALRAKNDGDLDPIDTAKVRGEIKAMKNLKSLLALGKKPDPAMVADEEQAD